MTGDEILVRLARALLLVVLLAAVGGCSLLRIGYTRLDTLAAWTADDYFELEPEQRHEFSKRFDRLHEWHRYEQLPDYVAFLDAAKARVERGFTREDFLWVLEGVRERYRTIVRRGTDDAAALLMTVTPAQLDALQRRWERVNRRFVREYRLDEGIEERRAARAGRVLSRIRDWTGSLTPEQENRITAMTNELPTVHGLRHDDRLRRQREFLKLMASRDDPREFAVRLRHWLLNWEAGRDPRYDRAFTEWTEKQADLYAAVARMLTPAQRSAVLRRLQGYIDDFNQLAQRPAAQAAADH
jgi:hypothetical protein